MLLLMTLIFTSGQRDKPAQDNRNQKNSGIYLHVVLVWLGWLYNWLDWCHKIILNEVATFFSTMKGSPLSSIPCFCVSIHATSKRIHLIVTSRLLRYLYQFGSCSSSPALPGPPGLLFIGNMKELTHNHLPIHLTNLARRYGNIYRLKCGNTSNNAWLHLRYSHVAAVGIQKTPIPTILLCLFSHGGT